MNRKVVSLSRLCMTTFLVTGLIIGTAQAGFQWNPPPAKPAAPAPAEAGQGLTAMPESVETGPLTPMPGDRLPVPAAPSPTGSTAPIPQVAEADILDNAPPTPPVLTTNNVAAETDTLPLPTSLVQNTPPARPAANVEGFGKDIPLAVALSQIVPPEYAISYETGIDQGKPVTWNGGRGWGDVVSDMLAMRKLHATLSGQTLTIAEGAGPSLQTPAPQLPLLVDDGIQSNPAVNSAPPARPLVDLTQQKHWEAIPGQSLQQTLLTWSKQAKVELAWENIGKGTDSKSGNIRIGSAFSYDGTFDQAVDALLSLYNTDGKLYPNLPEGPSVLLVSVK